MSEPLPLDGIKVVDLSQLIAGPSAALLLAEYGAEVIKIEPPGGDGGRELRSRSALNLPEPPVFAAYNRNKLTTRLDLRNEKERGIALGLIDQADVVLASSLPGAMDRLGLGQAQLLTRCPRLVYVAISGFGEDGPGREKRGVDVIVQAESGIMSTTGLPEVPVKVGFTMVDAAAAHALCHGVLAALLRRERTGRGGYVKTSLYEVALHLQTGPLSEYLATGVQEPRSGTSPPLTSPAGLMRCKDGAIVLAAYVESHWQALAKAIGDEDLLSDPRFAGGGNRVINRQALTERLERRLATRTAAEWVQILKQAGVLVGELKDYARVISDPCTAASGIVVKMNESFGIRNPITLEGSPEVTPKRSEEVSSDEVRFRSSANRGSNAG